jgi:hypothetical protein
MLRIMRFFCRQALPVGLLVAGLGAAVAQEGTPEARQACAPDAMRLCPDAIPDVPKITKCMIARYKELSEPCQLAMRHGYGGHHRVYRHHRRSYVHEKS